MLLDKDSFDWYSDITKRWAKQITGATGAEPSISAVGRHGTNGCHHGGRRMGNYRILSAAKGRLIMGASVKSTGLNRPLHTFGTNRAWLYFNSLNQLEVCTGSTSARTVLGVCDYLYSLNDEIYIELDVTFSTTVGVAVVYVNGIEVGNFTNLNLGASSEAKYGLGCLDGNIASADVPCDFDDFYLCDDSGSTNNAPLGDVRIDARRPTGAGSASGWTRGGADSGANWSQVDEADANGDTDYVAASTAGDKDLYTFDDLPSVAGDVYAVAVNYVAEKDDAGARVIKSKVRSGATEASGANYAPGTTYAIQSDVFDTNPATGNPWTIAEANGMEAGVEVVS